MSLLHQHLPGICSVPALPPYQRLARAPLQVGKCKPSNRCELCCGDHSSDWTPQSSARVPLCLKCIEEAVVALLGGWPGPPSFPGSTLGAPHPGASGGSWVLVGTELVRSSSAITSDDASSLCHDVTGSAPLSHSQQVVACVMTSQAVPLSHRQPVLARVMMSQEHSCP